MQPVKFSKQPFHKLLDIYYDEGVEWGKKIWKILSEQQILIRSYEKTNQHNYLFNISLAIIYAEWLKMALDINPYITEDWEFYFDELKFKWDLKEALNVAKNYNIELDLGTNDASTKYDIIYQIVYGLKKNIFIVLVNHFNSDNEIHQSLMESIATRINSDDPDSSFQLPYSFNETYSFDYILQNFDTI